jgi:hypothetical protein
MENHVNDIGDHIEDEIDAIRDAIWEEIKDMTGEQHDAYFHSIVEQARREYGLVLRTINVPPVRREATVSQSH